MRGDLETKVIVSQRVLHGSNQADVMQKVATVYIDGEEYRVLAPPEAKGDALEWVPLFSIRRRDIGGGQVEADDALSILALKVTTEELEKQKKAAERVQGKHPDGIHCDAQICLAGHVQHCDGTPFDSKAHCAKCGAACIDECPSCKQPIRGVQLYRPAAEYSRPQYCPACGRPYPWMEERLQTARELLYHDEKLTMEDRTKLFNDLRYVMSDPMAPLAPAKKKLIEIGLEKATGPVKELILDLVARTAAEFMKG